MPRPPCSQPVRKAEKVSGWLGVGVGVDVLAWVNPDANVLKPLPLPNEQVWCRFYSHQFPGGVADKSILGAVSPTALRECYSGRTHLARYGDGSGGGGGEGISGDGGGGDSGWLI